MNLFETIQDIEELRKFCKTQNETIKDLKDKVARYDYQYSSLESRITFYENIINYLINLKKNENNR